MTEWTIFKAAGLVILVGGMFIRLVIKESRRRERCLKLRLEEKKLADKLAEQQQKMVADSPKGGRGVLEALYLNRMLHKPKRPIWSAEGMFPETE